jgi:hypothetical protein
VTLIVRAPAQQEWDLELKPQCHQKKKKKEKIIRMYYWVGAFLKANLELRLTPVILASCTEIGRIKVQGQPRRIVPETSSPKSPDQNALEAWLKQ